MDKKDLQILRKLQKDASKSIKRLSKELGLPRSTVYDRIKRMREAGIIKGYTVVVDNKLIGNPITIFLLVAYEPNKEVSQRELARKLANIEGVTEVHIVGGEWDILLKVRGRSIEQLGNLILDRIRAMKGVKKTLTITSFSTVKEEYD
ncbi:MAG: Lrp/AsnC family transcriptional regulator [Candidatus Diapherotrites archaeon]|nr:Lrp/AsnC family transcriptional regulator [Candidatus Diapherotrites archaeon]